MLRTSVSRWSTVVTLVAFATACAGDGSPTGGSGPGGGGSGSMTAQINGGSWSSGSQQANAVTNVNNDITFYGISLGSYGIAINVGETQGPGMYEFTRTFPLRFAVVTRGTGESWGSTYGEGAGSLTITSMTETRVTGTFQFTAGVAPNSTGQQLLTVTNGQFDLPLFRP